MNILLVEVYAKLKFSVRLNLVMFTKRPRL